MDWLNSRYNATQTVRERIQQKRAQLLIHSCLYYVYDSPVVSDAKWDQWATELVKLHELFGTVIGFYDDEFKEWDGSTGYHLPVRDPFVTTAAERILKREKLRNKTL